MQLIKNILVSLIFIIMLLAFAAPAKAVISAPNFPTCSNPSGTLKVSYADGNHAIVGESSMRIGSDAVYNLESGNVQQCFCSIDGSGVQTNWWKTSSLSQEEINSLSKLGWIFVPNGSDWGLDSSSYMAKNSAYSCGGGTTTTVVTTSNPNAPVCTADRPAAPNVTSISKNGSSATLNWTKVDKATHYTIAYGTKIGEYPYGVPNTGNVTTYTINALDPNSKYYFIVYAVNDCMPSLPSSNSSGQVLGASTQVLGWASTGNMLTIVAFSILGLVAVSLGLFLRKNNS